MYFLQFWIIFFFIAVVDSLLTVIYSASSNTRCNNIAIFYSRHPWNICEALHQLKPPTFPLGDVIIRPLFSMTTAIAANFTDFSRDTFLTQIRFPLLWLLFAEAVTSAFAMSVPFSTLETTIPPCFSPYHSKHKSKQATYQPGWVTVSDPRFVLHCLVNISSFVDSILL